MNDYQLIEQALIDYQQLLSNLGSSGLSSNICEDRLGKAFDALTNLVNPIKKAAENGI